MYSVNDTGVRTHSVVKRSTDGGQSWSTLSTLFSPMPGWGIYFGSMYELPQAVADLPAGTIIPADNAWDSTSTPVPSPTGSRRRHDRRRGQRREGVQDGSTPRSTASLVVGLAGKSVNCRYTPENRAEIFRSRLTTTVALSGAVVRAAAPPPLWGELLHRDDLPSREDRPQTESAGELGTGLSVEVAKAWERALFADPLPRTRRVTLRTAIVLGDGGVMEPLRALAPRGSGRHAARRPLARVTATSRGRHGAHDFGARGGRQRFSWIHLDVVVGIIGFLERTPGSPAR